MAIFADDAPHVAGSVIMLTVVAFITYALRVYCRLSRSSWGAEDWLMTSAVVNAPLRALYQGAQLMFSIKTDTLLCAHGRLPWRRIQWDWCS